MQRILIILSIFSLGLFAQSGTNDEFYQYQWNLTKISASAAWTITTGSPSIIIAIVDQGVQSNHPDLINKLVTGYDVESNDYSTEPYPNLTYSYHGTASAGVAAAVTNNWIGIAGVGYNCKIMPIQVSHDQYWNSDNFAEAIIWASDHGADVISISGGTDEDTDVISAIDYATSNGRGGKGCIVVKSAGNSGTFDPPYNKMQFPAEYSKVLSVGATNQNDERISESSYGPELDVVAPSVVYTADLTGTSGYTLGDYMTDYNGTSSATPHVAGLAGLILSVDNTISENTVRNIICHTADDIASTGFDEFTGWGRINAFRAVKSADRQFTLVGILQDNEFWWGNITLGNEDVIVPNGVKLTIHSAATVNLNGHSIISTGGTIIVQPGATINGLRAKLTANLTPRGYCGSIQTAVNYAQEVNEIILENGNFNENVTITNKERLAIWGDYSQNYTQFGTLTVNNCFGLDAFGFGAKHMYVNNCDDALLLDLYATESNQSGVGLTLNYSDAIDIKNLYADYLNTGIDSYSSEADIEWSIIVNNNNGIKSWNASNIIVDSTIFCGTNTDLFAYNFSSINATYCAYDNGTPLISCSGGSTVQSLYNQSCNYLSKNSSESLYEDKSINGDPAESEFRKINQTYFSINKKFLQDKKDKTTDNKDTYCTDYERVIVDFKEFIKNNPYSPLSKIALATIARSYKRIDNLRGQKDSGSMKDFLTGIINSKEYSALQQTAERLMIDYYRSAGDFNTAITTADKLIEKYEKDGDFICDVMYAKGLMLSHNMEKPTEAAECFSAVVNNYPNNPLVESAQNELRILGKQVEADDEKKLTKTENLQLDVNNYPNPFNPTTKISFRLPQSSRVSLKVYDMLGREVANLADEVFEAGTYEREFDASNLASGIYFYTIKTTLGTISKKMLLVK